LSRTKEKKPGWLKVSIPSGERYRTVRRAVEAGGLHTVCQEARCPNVGECWQAGTATFMILGDACTRGCGFCAVSRGDPAGRVDAGEPDRVAAAAARMGLDYVVVTSVTRDDLPDGGAAIIASTIRAVKALEGGPLVEVLTPDYLGGDLAAVLGAGPEVFAHNIEVVERLTPIARHPRFRYRRSLDCLEQAARIGGAFVKSSIMLGIGETDGEVESAMRDLRSAGVSILVLGQYLRPTMAHLEVARYVTPDRFEGWAREGEAMGFSHVVAGPLVRTSYRAAEAFVRRARGAP